MDMENKFLSFTQYYHFNYQLRNDHIDVVKNNIKYLLTQAVKKRLVSDRPVGVFISGGVDSSLVAGLCKTIVGNVPLKSFAIGLVGSPDLENARLVANHIGSNHHEVNFTLEEGINAIGEVIFALETYDITTIRASVPQYLLSKYINEKTEVKVVLSGEGADEIFGGYLYFHYAKSSSDLMMETERLVRDLHQFDVLRADRTTAAHGLEVRVPFLDKRFVDYVLSLSGDVRNPKFNENIEKFILRDAFSKDDLIPRKILWRKKDAFSDAVGYGWVDAIKRYADKNVSEQDLASAASKYPNNPPHTKEGYLYRKLFEDMFPGRSGLINYYWMPRWVSNINDPSATFLDVHGYRKDD